MRLFSPKNRPVSLLVALRRAGISAAGCALLATGVAHAQQGGVVYIDDLEALERSSVALPSLGAVSPRNMTARPAPAPLPQASAGNAPRPNFGPRPQQADAPAEERGGLFGKLTPSWLRGDRGDARADVGGVSERALAQQPTFRPGPSRFDQQSVQQAQPIGAMATSGGVQQASFGAEAPRNGGPAMRRDNGPQRGLFSKLGLFASDEERQASEPAPRVAQRTADPRTVAGGVVKPGARQTPASPAPRPLRPSTAAASRFPASAAASPTPLAMGPSTVRPFSAERPSAAISTPRPATPKATKPSIIAAASPEAPATRADAVDSTMAGVVMVSDTPAPLASRTASNASSNTASKPTTTPKRKASIDAQVVKASPITDTVAKLDDAEHTASPAFQFAPAPIVSAPIAQEGSEPLASQTPVAESATLPPLPMPHTAEPFIPQTAPVAIATRVNAPTSLIPVEEDHRIPSERARTLLAEAHALAETAATADDYSAIVQRCRYVLAIDNTAQGIHYANQLAAWALNKRGESLLDAGSTDEASIDFLEAIAADPNCWRAEHNLGVIEAQKGAVESARSRFNRTIELNPEFAKAYSNRAALAVQEGNYSEALDDYSRAIAADPDLSVAHSGRGRVCHLLGYLDEAQRHLDAAQVLAPDDASIAVAQGDLLVDLGRHTQARAAYERGIVLDPEQSTPYRNLSWLLATCPVESVRNAQHALEAATKAEELAGEADDILLDTKAAALASLGRFEEAASVARKAIESAPADEAGAYRERLALYEAGKAYVTPTAAPVQQATYNGGSTRR